MSKNKSADITPANPLVITIDETSTNETVSGGISCRSHAAYIQQVSVEIKDSNDFAPTTLATPIVSAKSTKRST